MEYSLQTLNKNIKLNELKIQEIVDKLNLIGLEVDQVFEEKLETNKFIDNFRLEIAIPSNREDLLNEKFFINEFSTVFDLEKKENWTRIKNSYNFLLKQKYIRSTNHKKRKIKTNLKGLITYGFQLKNVKNTTTPKWVKNKLINSGINVVDNYLTNLINLIVLEWGQQLNNWVEKESQPYHIKQLMNTESFVTTKNEKIILDKGTIVLKNESNKILSILGLVDFKENILDESEYFIEATFYDIQENVLNLTTINTNLSYRYLRRVFLETFKFSLQRLLTLIQLTTKIEIIPISYKTEPNALAVQSSKILILQKESAKLILNIFEYKNDIFKRAGLKIVCETKDSLYFEIPTSRRDLTREIDLIEEYSRFIGYKNFASIIPTKELVYFNDKRKASEIIKQFFLNYGFNEVLTNSIYDNGKIEKETIKIANPLNNELSILRTALIPNLINVFETNFRSNHKNLKFFEIGRIFKRFQNQIIEHDKIGAIFTFDMQKSKIEDRLEWYQAKGFLENLLTMFGYKNCTFEKISSNLEQYYHPTRSTLIKSNGIYLGIFGQINPTYSQFQVLKQNVYCLELNLSLLPTWKTNAEIINYKEFSKYPSVTKDLSFKVKKETNLIRLKTLIRQNTENLKNIEFFDIYFDIKDPDTINIGLRLEFQATDQTLRTEIIEEQISKIISNLEYNFEIQL